MSQCPECTSVKIRQYALHARQCLSSDSHLDILGKVLGTPIRLQLLHQCIWKLPHHFSALLAGLRSHRIQENKHSILKLSWGHHLSVKKQEVNWCCYTGKAGIYCASVCALPRLLPCYWFWLRNPCLQSSLEEFHLLERIFFCYSKELLLIVVEARLDSLDWVQDRHQRDLLVCYHCFVWKLWIAYLAIPSWRISTFTIHVRAQKLKRWSWGKNVDS